MKNSSVKADFVMPILVLTLICLAMSAVLAFTNDLTFDIIEQGNAERAEAARIEVLPEADGFTLMDAALPEGCMVTEVYEATNGAGYVFMITSTGYGGKDTMKLICSMDNEGKIIQTKTLSHAETAGLGSKTADDDFRSQFTGKDASLAGVDTISGATISSNYYIAAIKDAFAAYEAIK